MGCVMGKLLAFRESSAMIKFLRSHKMLLEHQEENIKWIFARNPNHNKFSMICTRYKHRTFNIHQTFSSCKPFPFWPCVAKDTLFCIWYNRWSVSNELISHWLLPIIMSIWRQKFSWPIDYSLMSLITY